MTKPEFQILQKRDGTSGTSLKSFLKAEGVAYSTSNYRRRKMKAESEALPIAPISIRNESQEILGSGTGIGFPGVMVAFPNGARTHFGQGSELVLMEKLPQGKHPGPLARAVIRLLFPYRHTVLPITTDNGS